MDAEDAEGWRIADIHAEEFGSTRMRIAPLALLARWGLTRMGKSASIRLRNLGVRKIRVLRVYPFVEKTC